MSSSHQTSLKQQRLQLSSIRYYPIIAAIIHHVLSTNILLVLHDNLFYQSSTLPNGPQESPSNSNNLIAYFLLFYYTTTLILRYFSNNAAKTLYETMWLCNTTLLVGGFYSFITNRVTLSLGYVIAVCIDQVLWYVDLTFWFLSGRKKFPIGVAKYITWPSTPWTVKLTCTHHLWTIPTFLFVFSRSNKDYTTSMANIEDDLEQLDAENTKIMILNWNTSLRCYFLSCVVVTIHVILSRWLTPYSIMIHDSSSKEDHCKSEREHNNENDCALYLNVNLSYELWKDIKISFLQISKDNPTCIVYMRRLLWRWWVFNALIFFCLLRPIYNYFITSFAVKDSTSSGGEF